MRVIYEGYMRVRMLRGNMCVVHCHRIIIAASPPLPYHRCLTFPACGPFFAPFDGFFLLCNNTKLHLSCLVMRDVSRQVAGDVGAGSMKPFV